MRNCSICIGGYGVVSTMGTGFDSLRHSVFSGERRGNIRTFSVNGAGGYPFAVLPPAFALEKTGMFKGLAGVCLDEVTVSSGYSRDELFGDDTVFLAGVTSGMHHRWHGESPMHYREAVSTGEFIESDLLMSLCRDWGFRGQAMAVNTACASSLSALIMGCHLIEAGVARRVLVGAVELLNWYDVAGFSCAHLLSRTTCKPFDKRRDGLMLGEAAVFVLLEKLTMARSPHFEIIAGGANNDCYDIARPQPGGGNLQRCILRALEAGDLRAEDIDYVNAHGTGTIQNDLSESVVFSSLWPRAQSGTFISSTKGIHGHTRAAGGILELLICGAAIREAKVPFNMGCGEPDPSCGWNCGLKEDYQKEIRYAMSVSKGFGGTNAAVILGKVA